MKVKVHIYQESFKRKRFESCGMYLKSHLEGSSLKVKMHISQESHWEGSSLKVVVHGSQESFKRNSLKVKVHITQEIHLERSSLKVAVHIC